MVHVPDCLIFLEFFAGPHIVPATAAKQSNVVAQGWPQKGELPAALAAADPTPPWLKSQAARLDAARESAPQELWEP